MHFAKVYSQLLLDLPQELRDHAIDYRQLKKIIHAIVEELNGIGFSPSVLHGLRKVELVSNNDTASCYSDADNEILVMYRIDEKGYIKSQFHSQQTESNMPNIREPVPLRENDSFFNIIYATLDAIRIHSTVLRENIENQLSDLAQMVGDTARPLHKVDKHQKFYSAVETNPKALRSTHIFKRRKLDTDLPTWRALFQIYIQISPFESIVENSAGERSTEEVESRLKLFEQEIETIGTQFRDPASIQAVEQFWEINVMILDIKKHCAANSEALRKILKKHGKRTSLPPPSRTSTVSSKLPTDETSSTSSGVESILSPLFTGTMALPTTTEAPNLFRNETNTFLSNLTLSPETERLPKLMVQAIGERVLVVVPSIDDYSCAICTSLAFKPIRLSCRHLFCVRCLVKMQKTRQGECPICRSKDAVILANRSNVDWAVWNFMQDWFPNEMDEKGTENEMEIAYEIVKHNYWIGGTNPCRIS